MSAEDGIADFTCGNCGVGPMDDCDPACECDHCLTHREQPEAEATHHTEAA